MVCAFRRTSIPVLVSSSSSSMLSSCSMIFMVFVVVLFILHTPIHPVYAQEQQCPPLNFDAVSTLDLNKFTGTRWYSIKQLPVPYQPIEQFNCVFAQYDLITDDVSLRCRITGCTDIPSINVFNSARDDSTTGRPVSIKFKATIPDIMNEPGKANIGLRRIPNFLRQNTNYWVVAIGQYNDLDGLEDVDDNETQYEWAIITAGAPKRTSEIDDTKCYSSGGMWFFARTPNPPIGYEDALDDIATNLGLDISVLQPVNQTGCDYENAEGKFLSGVFVFFDGLFS